MPRQTYQLGLPSAMLVALGPIRLQTGLPLALFASRDTTPAPPTPASAPFVQQAPTADGGHPNARLALQVKIA